MIVFVMVLIENAPAVPLSNDLSINALLELVLASQVDDDANMKALSGESAELFEGRGIEESVRKLFAADEGMLETRTFFGNSASKRLRSSTDLSDRASQLCLSFLRPVRG